MFGSVVLGNSQFLDLVMVQQNRELRLLLSLRIECVCQLALLLGCQHLEVEVIRLLGHCQESCKNQIRLILRHR